MSLVCLDEVVWISAHISFHSVAANARHGLGFGKMQQWDGHFRRQ
jgi:hypothetical protein